MGEKTDSFLEAMENRNDMVRTTHNLKRTLLDRFKKFCSDRNILMSDLVNSLIQDFLEEHDGNL